ncbi:hypothetical protein EV363DRAFT_1452822 [Boletus edulis]|nr:hypothetical protein EV363DRAFT_1452822 [Boletus edulis]
MPSSSTEIERGRSCPYGSWTAFRHLRAWTDDQLFVVDTKDDDQVVEEIVLSGLETVQKRTIKRPDIDHPRNVIDVPAVSVPHSNTEGVPAGMVIDQIKDDEETVANTPAVVPKRLPTKKTKQQRTRIAKQKAEKHALAEKALRKRLLNSINQVNAFRSDISKLTDAQQQARLARQSRFD